MKTQIIQLTAHDDLISAQDKLSWVKASTIVLVLPDNNRHFQTRLDFVRLERRSARQGARLGLVTNDPLVKEIAAGLEIPVFANIDDAHTGSWRVGRHKKELQQPSDIELERSLIAEQRLKSIQSFRQTSGRVRQIVAIGILVVGLMAIAATVVPQATVVLTPPIQDQSANFEIIPDPAIQSPTLAGRIPARFEEFEVQESSRAQATGNVLMPFAVASGSVEVAYEGEEPIEIPAGTRLRSLTGEPWLAETISAVNLSPEETALVTVEVQALAPGSAGNLAEGTLDEMEGLHGSIVRVVQLDPLAGGKDKPQTVIAASDLGQLSEKVIESLQLQADALAQENLAADEIFFPTMIQFVTEPEITFDREVGEFAESIGVNANARISVPIFEKSHLEQLAELIMNEQSQPGWQGVPGSLVVARVGEGYWNGEGNYISASRRIFPAEGGLLLRKSIRAKPLRWVENYLSANYEGTIEEVTLSPPWFPTFPILLNRIQVIWSWNS